MSKKNKSHTAQGSQGSKAPGTKQDPTVETQSSSGPSAASDQEVQDFKEEDSPSVEELRKQVLDKIANSITLEDLDKGLSAVQAKIRVFQV